MDLAPTIPARPVLNEIIFCSKELLALFAAVFLFRHDPVVLSSRRAGLDLTTVLCGCVHPQSTHF